MGHIITLTALLIAFFSLTSDTASMQGNRLLEVYAQLTGQPTMPLSPPPAVLTGQPLAWRTLYRSRIILPGASGALGGVAVGNFDEDPDQEAVLIGIGTGNLFEPDGGHTPIGLHGAGFMMNLTAWDYDGDGIDEILPEAILYNVVNAPRSQDDDKSAPPLPTSTPVCKLDGKMAGELPFISGIIGKGLACADFDGDGMREVVGQVIGGDGSRDYNFYGTLGKVEASITLPNRGMDIGTGILVRGQPAWLLQQQFNPTALVAYSMSGGRIELGGWPPKVNANTPYCGDLDGDGVDEFFAGEGWLNPASGVFTSVTRPDVPPVKQPKGALELHTSTLQPQIVCGDFDADGTAEAVYAASMLDPTNDLWIYDREGRLTYHEIMPSQIWSMRKLSSGGRNYLIVQLTEKLLIYP